MQFLEFTQTNGHKICLNTPNISSFRQGNVGVTIVHVSEVEFRLHTAYEDFKSRLLKGI